MTKKCFKCGVEKPLDEFYKHSQMGDGHLNKCKDCTKNDVKEQYYRKKDDINYIYKERARGREKYYRLYTGMKVPYEYKKTIMEAYYTRYPEKKKARVSGVECSYPGFNNHHWSYNPEHLRDVIMMDFREHMKLHRYMTYDTDALMYRTMSGELLDTKEKHYNYYLTIKNLDEVYVPVH